MLAGMKWITVGLRRANGTFGVGVKIRWNDIWERTERDRTYILRKKIIKRRGRDGIGV